MNEGTEKHPPILAEGSVGYLLLAFGVPGGGAVAGGGEPEGWAVQSADGLNGVRGEIKELQEVRFGAFTAQEENALLRDGPIGPYSRTEQRRR